MASVTPIDIINQMVTVSFAIDLLKMEGITMTRQHFRRLLHRRGVPLYRVGRTLVFHPRAVAEIIEERQSRD